MGIRSILPESAVETIIDQLTTNSSLDLGITKLEWYDCLENPQVQYLLNMIGVEEEVFKDVFDCIDGDGSGIISTAELHEGLTVCRDPPRSHELLECRLKVREMQLWLHNRLKPEINQIRRLLVDLWSAHPKVSTQGRCLERNVTQEGPKHVDSRAEAGARQAECINIMGL